ncbi:MAG: T9SS type A sorting domain-containing protein [Bacteroidales bacterium]|nr:T9SS type A sorting domain-containing protein [Bacteroidales bacterium]
MKRKILIALVFVLAVFASIKTHAQTTDITVYYRANSSTDIMQDVKNFYFEGDNIVFVLGDGTSVSKAMSDVKKMTLNYTPSDFTEVEEMSVENGIFPNPAADMLYFNFDVTSDVTMQIYSATGQLVMEKNLSSENAVDISNLNEGLYIVKIDGRTYKFSKL